jgi:protoporphyrinogen oxidase
VYDVTVDGRRAGVSYVDTAGKTHLIKAKSVVMACPKFVVNRVLSQIEPFRAAAIKRLSYRAYITANVCIAGSKGAAPFYDLYMLGDGLKQGHDIRQAATATKVTDVIFATFARGSKDWTVLTLYRAFPYEGARGELLSPGSYSQYRQEFEKQIRESILPLLKINPKHVVDLRLARWGHPLPVHAPNLIADGVVETIRAPFKERVFFVEQDNWALPAFETVATEALHWAPRIDDFLTSQ